MPDRSSADADRPSAEQPRIGGSKPGSVGAAELRDSIARTRRIVFAGLGFWVLGGVSDLFVGASGQAPIGWLLSIRLGYGMVVLGVWLRLRRSPPPSEQLFDLLCRLTYVGAAFALGWYAVHWRGLESPAGHGVSAVLCVQAIGRPLPLRRGLAGMALTALGYPAAMLIGALLVPEVGAQLGDPSALAMLGFQVVLTVATAGLLAVGGDVTWSLKQRLHESRLVGRYRLDRKIGEGGMGEVWRAYHPALKKHVAIKILKGDIAHASGLSRFEREIAAMTELEHPHTVRVFDAGVTDDGLYYYAMELLEGDTLAEIVEARGPLSPARAVHLVRQAARAIGEAHGKGLIHRDVKPENLFIATLGGEPDFVKVLDFGIAKLLDETRGATVTREGITVGTPAYMAPEQARGLAVDARTDVYALGATLFYALTGRPPFGSGAVAAVLSAQLYEVPVPYSGLSPYAPIAALDALVARALEKEPEARFSSMAELDQALGGLGDLSSVPERAVSARVPAAANAETLSEMDEAHGAVG